MSLTKKIALLIIMVLTLFFMLVFIGQSIFFGRVYMSQKRQTLEDAVSNVSDFYTGNENHDEIRQYISEVSAQTSSNIIILNSQNNIIYSVSYQMSVQDDKGDVYQFILDEFAGDIKLHDLQLKKGRSVTVEYIPFEDSRIAAHFPIRISSKNGDVFSRGNGPHNKRRFAAKSVTGKITSITLPLKNNPSNRMDTMDIISGWINADTDYFGSSDVYYNIIKKDNNTRYMLIAKKEENSDTILAISPLLAVAETSRMFKTATFPWIIISVLIALLVAMIFARSILKPLLSITRITAKIKNLDFSEKCTLNSEDELGYLASNINDMSEKLDSTITQLVKANEKLKADIEKDRIIEQQRKEFVATVSHELKTPLAIIRAYTEGLTDDINEKRRARYTDVIIKETEKMDELILSMLENSRLESGAEKLRIKEHDISELVKSVAAVFEQTAAQIDVKINISLPETPVIYAFDIDKIEQVIKNFLSNATRHTPKGKCIYIEVTEDEAGCCVSVENEGNPIPESEQLLIWDRFYKADKARVRNDSGTGLGLSIAKNILKLHGADYSVCNTDRGVKFMFTLKKNN